MLPLPRPALLAGTAAAVAGTALLAACSSTSGGNATATEAVTVTGTDSACTPESTQLPAGAVTFRLENKGGRVNELYVLRQDGSIVGERENVGPGTSGDLTVDLPAGTYTLQCKPGMSGDGIRATVTATAASSAAAADPRLGAAVTAYGG